MNKQYLKDLLATQTQFFGDVAQDYLKPFRVVYAGIGTLILLGKEMFVSFTMDSDEYQKLQDQKLVDEVAELSKSGVSVEEIEAELDK